MIEKHLWVANSKLVAKVITHDDIIVDAAPILKIFTGQPLKNMVEWLKSQGEYTIKILQEKTNE